MENINHKLSLFQNFAVEFGEEAKSSEKKKKLTTEKSQPGNRSLWTRRGYLHGLFSQEALLLRCLSDRLNQEATSGIPGDTRWLFWGEGRELLLG